MHTHDRSLNLKYDSRQIGTLGLIYICDEIPFPAGVSQLYEDLGGALAYRFSFRFEEVPDAAVLFGKPFANSTSFEDAQRGFARSQALIDGMPIDHLLPWPSQNELTDHLRPGHSYQTLLLRYQSGSPISPRVIEKVDRLGKFIELKYIINNP